MVFSEGICDFEELSWRLEASAEFWVFPLWKILVNDVYGLHNVPNGLIRYCELYSGEGDGSRISKVVEKTR